MVCLPPSCPPPYHHPTPPQLSPQPSHRSLPHRLTCSLAALLQVGNPKRYSTKGDPLSDVDKFRKWTNIKADITDTPRVAYYVTAEDNAGDAVGSAAAALAAAAAVARKRGDMVAANKYVERAGKIFALASGDQALKKEKSFCLSSRMIINSKQKAAEEVKEFSVPETVCSFHIEVPTATLVQEVKDKVEPADTIQCWVADFSSKTCTPRDSHVACKAARKSMNVYKRWALRLWADCDGGSE
jgi:hypothetical protein